MKNGVKRIDDAVVDLSPKVQQALIEAFKATGFMDLYEGDLLSYIQVIHDVLKSRENQLKEFQRACKIITEILNNLSF